MRVQDFRKYIGPSEPAGGEALWVDTDEDVPIPEGGLQMVKVWENASPTSAFTAQTITIPAGYDAVLIESYGAAPTFIGYGDGNYMITYYNVSVALRFCNFNTNNSLVFNNVVGPAGVSNDYAVPRDIYGIKGVRY